jgi:hypothetical protein
MRFQICSRFQHMPMQRESTGLSPSRCGDLEQIISILVVKLISPGFSRDHYLVMAKEPYSG